MVRNTVRNAARKYLSLTITAGTALVIGCSSEPGTPVEPEFTGVEVGLELIEKSSVLVNPASVHVTVGQTIVLWARTVDNGRGIPASAPTWTIDNANVTLRDLERVPGGDWTRVEVSGVLPGKTTAIATYKGMSDTVAVWAVPAR